MEAPKAAELLSALGHASRLAIRLLVEAGPGGLAKEGALWRHPKPRAHPNPAARRAPKF